MYLSPEAGTIAHQILLNSGTVIGRRGPVEWGGGVEWAAGIQAYGLFLRSLDFILWVMGSL